jgi:hypothetical protein
MKITIAIDPGVSGGIAWNKDGQIGTCPMPAAQPELVEFFCLLIAGTVNQVAWIEDVPKFVGKMIPSSTTAVLFFNVGYVEGVLAAKGVRIVRVRPHDWQKHFRLGTKKDCSGTTEWKNKLKSEAIRRFPSQKVTLATADALLILDYANEKGLAPSN